MRRVHEVRRPVSASPGLKKAILGVDDLLLIRRPQGLRRLLSAGGRLRPCANTVVSSPAAASVQEGRAKIGREERVEYRIETRVAVGKTLSNDLEDHEAAVFSDVVHVEFAQEQHDLQGTLLVQHVLCAGTYV